MKETDIESGAGNYKQHATILEGESHLGGNIDLKRSLATIPPEPFTRRDILCECDGTSRAVLSCLQSSNVATSSQEEEGHVSLVQQCAKQGLNRLAQLTRTSRPTSSGTAGLKGH